MDSGDPVVSTALMSIRTTPWPAGIPCWADLTVPDVEAAKGFYGSVIGWSFAATDDEFGGYTIAQAAEAAAAGIGLQPEGASNAWTLYFASDDVDATAAAIRAAGGTVLLEPGDIGPLGRMCIAMDPSGGAFGVWQAGQHIGAGIVNDPGGLMWEDLRSTDPTAAVDFYTTVFGYRAEGLAEAGPDYSLFFLGDEQTPLGGMGGMMGAPEGTPSHWLVYFAVADADAAAEAAATSGGTVLSAPFDTPYGRMAPITDPWGAPFFITQANADAQHPDRAG